MASIEVLHRPFDSNKFNRLPDIDSVANDDINQAVTNALRIVDSHGLAEFISVERNHKHWPAQQNTPMTYIVAPTHSDGMPVTIQPMVLDSDQSFPVSWALVNGNLMPTAFMQRSGEATCRMEQALAAVMKSPRLADFVAALKAESDSFRTAVAFSLRFDVFLFGGFAVREDSFDDDQHQTLTVIDGPTTADDTKQAVETSWSVPGKAGGKPWTRACTRYCEWGPFKGHTTYHSR